MPITEKMRPNPYLPLKGRDVVTLDGLELTKINPAYLTRQISEIDEMNNINFHLTSLKPIRPGNKANAWENRFLNSFSDEKNELYETGESPSGDPVFRYMIPYQVEESCLKCHAVQGYKEGDQRGGISLTIKLGPIVSAQETYLSQVNLMFFSIWLLSMAGIIICFKHLQKGDDNRLKLIGSLQDALTEVKHLSGLLPICANCKKIRDDKGYWQQIEVYIGKHSDAQFSHGICLDCAKTLYPELYGNVKKEEDMISDDELKKLS